MSWLPHHALVMPEDARPGGALLFLHGILGSGANWRTIARRLVTARPDWGAVLVDLRKHGRSQDAPPPHTLEAVAGDLARLADDLAGRGMTVAAVVGHSFGGKAALAYRRRAPESLLDTWVLDASPSVRPAPDLTGPAAETPGEGAEDVVRMLAAIPGQFSSRDEFLAAVVERGFSRMLAEWLAMNLEREGSRLRLRLDLGAIRDLLSDYFAQDLWTAVEADLPGALRFVVAGRSKAVGGPDRERMQAAAELHVIAEAGHWLHLDAPDRLLALLSEGLARPRAPERP